MGFSSSESKSLLYFIGLSNGLCTLSTFFGCMVSMKVCEVFSCGSEEPCVFEAVLPIVLIVTLILTGVDNFRSNGKDVPRSRLLYLTRSFVRGLSC